MRRTEVARQVRLGCGDRLFAGAAQRDGDSPYGADKLPRGEDAEGSHHGNAPLLRPLHAHGRGERLVGDGVEQGTG
jgi:hypothetical protein